MKNNDNINKVIREQKFFHTPFYKRKSVIISTSSILGLGALTAAIVTPVVLLTGEKPLNFSNDINILNAPENKDNQIKIWNDYFLAISSQNIANNYKNQKNLLTWSPDGIKQRKFLELKKDINFINEFILMLENNLLIAQSTTNNAISKEDLSLLMQEIKSLAIDIASNEHSGAPDSFGSYWRPNSFQLIPQENTTNQNNKIWYFHNQDGSIKYEFIMPNNNVSLEYLPNASKAKIKNNWNSKIGANNVKLNVFSKSIPAFNVKKSIYFKENTYIDIPNKLFEGFSDFFAVQKKNATSSNVKYKNYFENLKRQMSINSGISLTLWNQFILNYSPINDAHIESDLKSKDSKMLELISDIAKDNSSNTIKLNDALASFKNTIQNPVPTDHTEIIQPTKYGLVNFGSKSVDTDDLFLRFILNTIPANQGDPIIKVQEFSTFFDILEFDFDVKFNSFFSVNKLVLTPKIKIGPNSKFEAILTAGGKLQTYQITPGWYEINSLIDSNYSLANFFDILINNETSEITKLTNSLIKFNANKNSNKISVWNDYVTKMSNTILATLQNNLSSNTFIKSVLSNVRTNLLVPNGQASNSFQINTSVKNNTFSNNFTREMSTLNSLDFTVSPGKVNPVISFVNPIKYDSSNGYYVDIYFGVEDSNFSSVNMNLAQTPAGSITNYSSFAIEQTVPRIPLQNASNLIAAAKKRFSIVLKDSIDQSIMFVGFLGLKMESDNVLHTSGYTLYNNFFDKDIFISSIDKIL